MFGFSFGSLSASFLLNEETVFTYANGVYPTYCVVGKSTADVLRDFTSLIIPDEALAYSSAENDVRPLPSKRAHRNEITHMCEVKKKKKVKECRSQPWD